VALQELATIVETATARLSGRGGLPTPRAGAA
jgi:hypothetical protein